MATTATALSAATPAPRRFVRLPGAGTIFRKELLEQVRTRRFPAAAILGALAISVAPLNVPTNVVEEAVISNGLVMSAYLALILTGDMLPRERATGTAQWLFTKPVSRVGYGLAKWAANSLAAVLVGVLLPALVALALMAPIVDLSNWTGKVLAYGIMSAHVAIVVGLMLALGTVFNGTTTVVGLALGISAAPNLLLLLVREKIVDAFPVFMLDELVRDVATGRPVGGSDLVPLATGLVLLALCLAFAGFRLHRQQLQ